MLAVNPPRKAKQMTLQIAGWQETPGKGPLVGIDNIYLKAQRPPEFYEKVKPLLNVGGMMEYPRGKGGIVLCNLNFKETEEVPANADKKRNILAALLRNLKAPFAGRTVIAGANLRLRADRPVEAGHAVPRREGLVRRQEVHLPRPADRQAELAGVPYDVYEFPTSPVPTVVMLAGAGAVPRGNLPAEVKGIPVEPQGRRAVLPPGRPGRPAPRARRRQEGQEATSWPATSSTTPTARRRRCRCTREVDVDDYRQHVAGRAPGAQIAWTRPYEGTDQSAVAYSMQWNNPRPDVAITTIDLLPGADKAGAPALLALTAATGAVATADERMEPRIISQARAALRLPWFELFPAMPRPAPSSERGLSWRPDRHRVPFPPPVRRTCPARRVRGRSPVGSVPFVSSEGNIRAVIKRHFPLLKATASGWVRNNAMRLFGGAGAVHDPLDGAAAGHHHQGRGRHPAEQGVARTQVTEQITDLMGVRRWRWPSSP